MRPIPLDSTPTRLDYRYSVVLILRLLIDGYVGCVVIRPDGSRELARAVPDPLAEQSPD